MKNYSPTMLIILDGFGYRKELDGNAIKAAKMPNWKEWLTMYPNCLLKASEEAVGLLPGYMGNSEVGHTCMGSGRIVKTTLDKFHENINNKSFFKKELLLKSFEKLKKENKALHLMGLLSDAGVHSHECHLHAFIELASIVGLEKVFIHAFLDGRDTPPKSAATYLQRLDDICKKFNCAKLATMHGRFYAMDRDNNWDRTQVSYNILTARQDPSTTVHPEPVEGRANGRMNLTSSTNSKNITWQQALEDSYANNITDEFFCPVQLQQDGIIQKGDGVIFFNFRPDRARQLTESFINPEFKEVKTNDLNSTTKTLEFFITTTRYKKEFEKFKNDILFEKENIKHTLLDEISTQAEKPVFVIAETEKYAHVTYFFRGMSEKKLPNETYTLIPSIKAKNYINLPQMSAEKITDAVLKSLQSDPAYFYLINYANPDMVGHSGDFDATVKACQFVDKQLEKLYKEVIEKQNGTIFITGDHGNAEEMNGKYSTSHTTNPVVFMMINKKFEGKMTESELGLANIAPTILKHLELKIPNEMEQKTIF